MAAEIKKKNCFILLIALTGLFVTAQTYNSTAVISGLQYPVAFDVAPDGRFFITEKGDGSNTVSQKSRILVYSTTGSLIGTFYDLSDSAISSSERGVLGIALDPDFTTNHYVYVYYNHLYNNDQRIRIARFTEASNTGINPLVIFDLDVDNSIAGNHVGGNLHFRPSQPNQLYFTIGDLGAQQSNPALNFANKLTNPYGKTLRINKSGTIPTDNPFYDDGNPTATNCDWIWSYGHRNPFDFCFSPVTDSMYCSENGVSSWDEVNLISKGSFYGWANCEGNYVNGSTTTLCTVPGAVNPISTWGTPVPALTGILYYSGTVWSALNNHLLVADNNNGNIYDCTLGNAPSYNTVTNKVLLGDITAEGLTTLKQSADGCVYALNGGYTTNGTIYKLCPLNIGIEERGSQAIEMAVYPNPATDHINIDLNLTEEKKVLLQLTDIFGNIVSTENSNAMPGKTTLKISFENHLKGVYFIQVKDSSTWQLLDAKKIILE